MEQWKAIEGFDGSYEVSNMGNVRTLDRERNGVYGCKRVFKGKNLKPVKLKNGYVKVAISEYPKKVHQKNIHRLVAETFIPRIEGKDYVNHKDGDKLNNSLGNLEWCTFAENMQHAYNTGLIPSKRHTKN